MTGNGKLIRYRPADNLPARAEAVRALEAEVRREQAVLDIMRRARADVREQVEVLRRVIGHAVAVVNLVDEMRVAGELVDAKGQPGTLPSELRKASLEDLGLTNQRVSEWRVARDRDALGYLEQLVAGGQEEAFERASIAWLVREVNRGARPDPHDTPPLPGDRYRCIVIDPPWPMDRIVRNTRPRQAAGLDYPTWTLEQIAELPVGELVDPAGCHLYLWVTHRFLPTGLDILGEWGARYECALTWIKPGGPTPFSWQYNTEHALFARAGAGLDLECNGAKLSLEAPTTGHSRKPEAFYDRVREVSPGPRLNMFNAGRELDGFDAWGAHR